MLNPVVAKLLLFVVAACVYIVIGLIARMLHRKHRILSMLVTVVDCALLMLLLYSLFIAVRLSAAWFFPMLLVFIAVFVGLDAITGAIWNLWLRPAPAKQANDDDEDAPAVKPRRAILDDEDEFGGVENEDDGENGAPAVTPSRAILDDDDYVPPVSTPTSPITPSRAIWDDTAIAPETEDAAEPLSNKDDDTLSDIPAVTEPVFRGLTAVERPALR